GATHRLLTTRLGASLPRPTLVRLHDRAAGNPFHALELGRSLLRRGTDAGAAPAPEDLAGLLRERLSQSTGAIPAANAVAALARAGVDEVIAACDGDRRSLAAAVEAGVLELDGAGRPASCSTRRSRPSSGWGHGSGRSRPARSSRGSAAGRPPQAAS